MDAEPMYLNAHADAYFGRRVPGLVHALGWEGFDADSATVIASPGEPAFEALRLAWPEYQRAGRAFGVDEAQRFVAAGETVRRESGFSPVGLRGRRLPDCDTLALAFHTLGRLEPVS